MKKMRRLAGKVHTGREERDDRTLWEGENPFKEEVR